MLHFWSLHLPYNINIYIYKSPRHVNIPYKEHLEVFSWETADRKRGAGLFPSSFSAARRDEYGELFEDYGFLQRVRTLGTGGAVMAYPHEPLDICGRLLAFGQ